MIIKTCGMKKRLVMSISLLVWKLIDGNYARFLRHWKTWLLGLDAALAETSFFGNRPGIVLIGWVLNTHFKYI